MAHLYTAWVRSSWSVKLHQYARVTVVSTTWLSGTSTYTICHLSSSLISIWINNNDYFALVKDVQHYQSISRLAFLRMGTVHFIDCRSRCKRQTFFFFLWILTLTLPGPFAAVSGSLDSYCSLKPLCSGMGEVVPARTSPTLLSPIPSHCAVITLFQSVTVHQLSWLAL